MERFKKFKGKISNKFANVILNILGDKLFYFVNSERNLEDKKMQIIAGLKNELTQARANNVTIKTDLQDKLTKQIARNKLVTPWVTQLHRIFDFANWVETKTEGKKYSICLVHDSLGLEAVKDKKGKLFDKLIYDCVEYPEYRNRGGLSTDFYRANQRYTDLVELNESYILKQVDVLIAGTPLVAEWFSSSERFLDPVYVRNCREYQKVSRSDDIRKECGVDDSDILILYPNTVFNSCGLDHCVKALKYCSSKIHIAVMGSMLSTIKQDLIDLAKQAGALERLHFVGLRSPSEIIDFRSGADLALIPLDPEIPNHATGLPNRVFESIMSRLPIISSDIPLLADLINEHGNGIVFKSKSPKKIAETFDLLLNEEFQKKLEDKAALAAQELNWEKEQLRFESALTRVSSDLSGTKILLLTNKPISTNDRYYRFSKYLANKGADVTSLSLELPYDELKIDGIDYDAYQSEQVRKGPASRPPRKLQ